MKFLSTLVLMIAFLGSAAHAYQGTLQFSKDGSFVIKPLTAKCAPDVASLENAPATCDSAGHSCPEGYTSTRKYCWGGWSHGFYHCGYACDKKPDCTYGPYKNPKCGNPGSGNHGSNAGRG